MFTSVTKIAFSIVVPLSVAISTAWATPKSAKVGVILPLSGEFAILGEACKNGAQLAASELKNEGVALDLLIQDSPSCRATATLSAYQKLRSSDNVQVFFGFVSPEEIAAVGPLVERDGTALVGFTSPKASPKNSLMVWMSPEVEAQRLAVEVYRRHRDVAILSADQQWERDVSDAFSAEYTKLGGRISLRVEAPFTSKDLRAEVLKVRRTTATAVVIPHRTRYFQAMRKLCGELGPDCPSTA